MLNPLKRPTFRTLWAGMGLSYAGDRLQELAQGWLVATLTGSALAVGGLGVLSSIPMLLMPLGGVIADQADRRRLLMAGQAAGALLTGVMAALALSNRIAVWHIYAWAFISGVVWMVIRPAYKVIVTQAVPPEEVRPAVSLNSITETSAMVAMNTGGSALIQWLGLPVAFIINAASYLVAIFCLGRLRGLGRPAEGLTGRISATQVFADLKDGFIYLRSQKALLYPLLFTLAGNILLSPASSLLAAIVHGQGAGIVALGLLGGAASLGALAGAALRRHEERRPAHAHLSPLRPAGGGRHARLRPAPRQSHRRAGPLCLGLPGLCPGGLEHQPGAAPGRPRLPGPPAVPHLHDLHSGCPSGRPVGRRGGGPLRPAGAHGRGGGSGGNFNSCFTGWQKAGVKGGRGKATLARAGRCSQAGEMPFPSYSL
jgi:MFS family permease